MNRDSNEQISVKVKDQNGSVIIFKMKRNTIFKKLMNAYCERFGFFRSSVRFVFDGEAVKDNDTPMKLRIDDNDQIDAMIEQKGGSSNKII